MERRWFVVLAVAVAIWPAFVLAQDTGTGETTSIDALSNFALWSLLGGSITSLATSIIGRARWQSETKLAAFFVLSCITAGINAYFNRSLNFDDWVRSLMIVLVSGIATYHATKPAMRAIDAKTG
jgi:peptidoglycan/LPS O-acetylase OafA/YrhL